MLRPTLIVAGLACVFVPFAYAAERGTGVTMTVRPAEALTSVNAGVFNASSLKARYHMPPMSQQEAAQVMAALYRVGLDPQALTAAGIEPDQANAVLVSASIFLLNAEALPAIKDADRTVALANNPAAVKDAPVQDPNAAANASTTPPKLPVARSLRAEVLENVFVGSTSLLTAEQITTLRRIKANRQRWGLPVEYLTVDRTDAEWMQLREQLAVARAQAQEGGNGSTTGRSAAPNAKSVAAGDKADAKPKLSAPLPRPRSVITVDTAEADIRKDRIKFNAPLIQNNWRTLLGL